MSEVKRWRVVASYRSSFGPVVPVEWAIEELDELAALIELSPDWNALVDIRITLARRTNPGAAIDRAGNAGDAA